MDPSSTSESLIPPHDAVPGHSHYTEQNDQSLAGFLGSTGVNVGPSSHPPHPYTLPHDPFIPGYVPNLPSRQGQSYSQPASLPGEGPRSHTDFHTTPAQWDVTRWGDPNRPMEQAGITTHSSFTLPQWTPNDPGPSAPTELPSTMIPHTLPSSSQVQSYTTSEVQAPHRTNRERHNEPDVDPGTQGSLMEQGPSAKPSKKRKDMLRKRDQRADDRQHFARICELLDIPTSPKKTLAHRILAGVEELVKQRELDEALRRQLGVGEIDLAVLRKELAQDSNDTAPGPSDIGTTPSHGLCPMVRDADEGHN